MQIVLLTCLLPGRDDAHDFSVSRELPFDLRLTTHALHARADAQRGNFKHQSVTRNNRTPKTRFFNAGKQHELLVAVLDLTQSQHRADLGQRFDHEHARHHRRAGKVALEIRLVDTDLLDADDSFARHEFYDAIDEEKRITMRQELLNREGIENCFHRNLQFPIADRDRQSSQFQIGNWQSAMAIYSGGVVVVAAVTGFLLLKSAMNARVMSMLSDAYNKPCTCAASMIMLMPRALANASSARLISSCSGLKSSCRRRLYAACASSPLR